MLESVKANSFRDDSFSYKTHVVVKVSGPYEFLVDITSTKPKKHRGLR